MTTDSYSRLEEDDLEMLVLVRRFEETVLDLFARGSLNGTTHACIGQETVPVALVPMLADRDYLFSNHRGHGHYLTRFRDPRGLLAELMGREGAVCRGAGGSQHLGRGRYFSTGVQGEGVAVAAGAALHLKDHEPGGLAMAFVGDGTWGQGVVYEALNMACLWSLPLVVAVENNRIAQTTPVERNMAGGIEGRARAFGAGYQRVTAGEIDAMRAALAGPIEAVRGGRGPLVVEFETDRLAAHSKGDDTRDPTQVAALRERDPYALYRRRMPERFAAAEARTGATLDALVRELEAMPPSTWSLS